MEPIRLSPRVYEALTLESWNALPDHDRVMVADHLTERLEEAGWLLPEPPAVRTFGPAGEPQAILQVRDGKTGLPFSLVPGGTFRPGIPNDLLEQFRTVYLAFESWKGELEEEEPDEDEEEEPHWEPESPNAVWPFASNAPCDLTQKAEQRIEPFLFAAELITPRLPGLDAVAGELSGYARKRWERGVERFEGWMPRWEKVEPILQHFGWDLPTTWEFEWAVRGGVDGLFYWGGPPPDFQAASGAESGPLTLDEVFDAVMTYAFPPGRPRTWPYCNRFGLAAMLGAGTWCRPSEEEGDELPLILRGGAAACWGWQGCKEWLLLLTACESRQRLATDYGDHNAIRPVVRLVPDSAVPLS